MKSPLQIFLVLVLFVFSLDISGLRSVAVYPLSDSHNSSHIDAKLSKVSVVLFDCTQTPPLSFQFNQILPLPTLKEHLRDWLPDGQICRQVVEHIRLKRYLLSSEMLVPGLSPVYIAFPFHYFY